MPPKMSQEKTKLAEWRGRTTAVLETFDRDINRQDRRIDKVHDRIEKAETKIDHLEDRIDENEKEVLRSHGKCMELLHELETKLTGKIHEIDIKLALKVGGIGGGSGVAAAILFELIKIGLQSANLLP
jgi:predicted RNase H-like nuclease (RuvC/YqgF family)